MWLYKINVSLILLNFILLNFLNKLDCCVLEYKISEYAPAMKIANPIHNILTNLILIILIIHTTSAIKFTKGGAAILLIIVINHKKEIKGDSPKIPFLSKILRENERK